MMRDTSLSTPWIRPVMSFCRPPMAGELELAGELGPARAIRLFPRAMPSDSSWLDVAAGCGGSAFTRIFETCGRELFTSLRVIGPFTARITELTRRQSHLDHLFECGVYLNQTLHPTMKDIEGDGSSASASGPTTCKTINSKCMNEWPWRDLPNKWSSAEVVDG